MKLPFTALILTLNIILFGAIAHSDETITDKSTGLIFPKEISFDAYGKHYELEATGVTTRKKLIIKVYSIASYLQKQAGQNFQDKFQKVLAENSAKQLTMRYVRDVSANQVQDAFQDSFKRVFQAQEYTLMQENIAEFLQYFKRGIHKGDEFMLRWVPGNGLEVLLNGTSLGTINNDAFAKGLWNIWFDKNSIVDRSDLVSLMN